MRILAIASLCVVAGAPSLAGAVPPKAWKERIAPYRAALLDVGKANRAKPKAERLSGDKLADAYLRAGTARLRAVLADLDPVRDRKARTEAGREFLVAMGALLDTSGALARHPLVRLVLGDLETADERKARAKTIGAPRVRGRDDWCRHLWVSASLRALVGRSMAENVGVAKEFKDAARKSEGGKTEGFSIGDLMANLSGIALAERVLAGGTKVDALIEQLAAKGRHADWMPEVPELPTELDATQAKTHYGHAGDDRMKRLLGTLRAVVKTAPGHAPAKPR